ncbi:MAG: hypothetical protein IJT27_09905 [Clostridia bacterium]|nr:hypothetical protein [Clostridia bacterium]
MAGLLAVGALWFLPAGMFSCWQAWPPIGVLSVPMFCAGVGRVLKNPALLQK